jgi:urease accessory protein
MRRLSLTLAALALTTTPALAHLDPGAHGSFAAGFSHPLFGLDHVLAMVTVGLWGALIGGRALWLVPAAFVAAMIAGFLASVTALPLPMVEPVILASVVVMGLLVAIALPVPISVGLALVAGFGFFHGHAHGSEIGTAGLAAYGTGFVVATSLLHLAGIALGRGLLRGIGPAAGRTGIRIAGVAAAAGGVALALAS